MMNAMKLVVVFDKNVPINEKVLQQTRKMLQKCSDEYPVNAGFYDLRITLFTYTISIKSISLFIYLLKKMQLLEDAINNY